MHVDARVIKHARCAAVGIAEADQRRNQRARLVRQIARRDDQSQLDGVESSESRVCEVSERAESRPGRSEARVARVDVRRRADRVERLRVGGEMRQRRRSGVEDSVDLRQRAENAELARRN